MNKWAIFLGIWSITQKDFLFLFESIQTNNKSFMNLKSLFLFSRYIYIYKFIQISKYLV